MGPEMRVTPASASSAMLLVAPTWLRSMLPLLVSAPASRPSVAPVVLASTPPARVRLAERLTRLASPVRVTTGLSVASLVPELASVARPAPLPLPSVRALASERPAISRVAARLTVTPPEPSAESAPSVSVPLATVVPPE